VPEEIISNSGFKSKAGETMLDYFLQKLIFSTV
jgi:hypothetical protein